MVNLTRAHAKLKRLHELPAVASESAAEIGLAYLKASCDMFGFRAAAIRGDS